MLEWLLNLSASFWAYLIIVVLSYGFIKGSMYLRFVRSDKDYVWCSFDNVMTLGCAFSIIGAIIVFLGIRTAKDPIGFRFCIPRS